MWWNPLRVRIAFHSKLLVAQEFFIGQLTSPSPNQKCIRYTKIKPQLSSSRVDYKQVSVCLCIFGLSTLNPFALRRALD